MLGLHCTRMNLWMKALGFSWTELLESLIPALPIPWHLVRADQRCSDGVSLRHLLASVFMSSIKEKLDVQGKLPPYYRRYVHDKLNMMPDLSTARDFLNTLNHTQPAMKFTMEVENYGMSPSSVFNS